jgi:hypothetical protein
MGVCRRTVWSFPKSAGCTTATSAKPRSPAFAVVYGPHRADPSACRLCSLSVTYREPAGTAHGRGSEETGRPVPDPPRGGGARMTGGHERVGRDFGEVQEALGRL